MMMWPRRVVSKQRLSLNFHKVNEVEKSCESRVIFE